MPGIHKGQFVQTSDGVRIACNHYRRGFPRLVIIAHGFYSSKDVVLLKGLADDLTGVDVLILDFRGHGHSTGVFCWTAKEYLDLLAVVQYADGLYERIGVIGLSLGAATTLITSGKTDSIDSVIAVSAPAEFGKIEYKFWEMDPAIDIKYNLFGEGRLGKGIRPGPFWLFKEKPIDVVGKIKQPVFYVHGTRDWLIKPWHAQALYEKTGSFKKIEMIEGGPHAEYLFLKHRHFLVSMIRDWFQKTL